MIIVMEKQANSLKYWFLASRPKTLAAALMPVCVATALAYSDGKMRWNVALICAIFAILMQIAANFINDLYDYLKGTDGEDRLGPQRACAQGWITPHAMRIGIGITLALACAVGCCLLPFGGLKLVIIGALCVVFAFLYTTLLSYIGCGDVLVWVFFGFVPVCGTYYVQAQSLTTTVWIVAAACGLVTDTLLVLNNFRDYAQDRVGGKRTLIVVLGKKFGSLFYLFQGLLGYLCIAFISGSAHYCGILIVLIYLIPHISTWRTMNKIGEGKELNRVLGLTARNILIFGILVSLSFVLDRMIGIVW